MYEKKGLGAGDWGRKSRFQVPGARCQVRGLWPGGRRPARHSSFYCGPSTVNCRLFYRNEAGMSLKTKDRVGELGNEAVMSMKTKDLANKSRNVIEKKGG